MRLLLVTLTVVGTMLASETVTISSDEQLQLIEAQLAAERADHALDKAKLEYMQAATYRDKAFAEAQKTLASVLEKHGCTTEEVEKHTCQVSESAADKDGRKHLTVVKSKPSVKP
jgi:hypothetical protein